MDGFITTEVHRTAKHTEDIVLVAQGQKQTGPHLRSSEDTHCG